MVTLLLISAPLLAHRTLFQSIAKAILGGLQFRSQACQVLAVFADFVGFAGGALSNSLFIVKPSAMLLLKAFDVLILRHGGWRVMLQQESKSTCGFCGESAEAAL